MLVPELPGPSASIPERVQSIVRPNIDGRHGDRCADAVPSSGIPEAAEREMRKILDNNGPGMVDHRSEQPFRPLPGGRSRRARVPLLRRDRGCGGARPRRDADRQRPRRPAATPARRTPSFPLDIVFCAACALVQLGYAAARRRASSTRSTRTSRRSPTRSCRTPPRTSTGSSRRAASARARSPSRSPATTATCCATSSPPASARSASIRRRARRRPPRRSACRRSSASSVSSRRTRDASPSTDRPT